jgi:hypothetical protein
MRPLEAAFDSSAEEVIKLNQQAPQEHQYSEEEQPEPPQKGAGLSIEEILAEAEAFDAEAPDGPGA